MKMPIPQDWDGTGFCDYVVNWPDSSSWKQILMGLLTNPSLEVFWDGSEDDVLEIIADFQPTLNPNLDELECDVMKIPIGTIVCFAGSTPPENWLLCDGSTPLQADYPELYTMIGTTYGSGGGAGTFRLPDFRSRVAVGKETGSTNFGGLGYVGGAETHTLTEAQMPAHTHPIGNGSQSGYVYFRNTVSPTLTSLGAGSVMSVSGVIQPTGGGGSHNNVQPYLTVNYIIRAA